MISSQALAAEKAAEEAATKAQAKAQAAAAEEAEAKAQAAAAGLITLINNPKKGPTIGSIIKRSPVNNNDAVPREHVMELARITRELAYELSKYDTSLVATYNKNRINPLFMKIFGSLV